MIKLNNIKYFSFTYVIGVSKFDKAKHSYLSIIRQLTKSKYNMLSYDYKIKYNMLSYDYKIKE